MGKIGWWYNCQRSNGSTKHNLFVCFNVVMMMWWWGINVVEHSGWGEGEDIIGRLLSIYKKREKKTLHCAGLLSLVCKILCKLACLNEDHLRLIGGRAVVQDDILHVASTAILLLGRHSHSWVTTTFLPKISLTITFTFTLAVGAINQRSGISI